MKKIIALLLTMVLCISAVSCSNKVEGPKFESYGELLDAVRTQDEKTNFPMVTDKADEMSEGVFAMLGLNADDIDSFAAACSFMNVSAYCIAVIKPVKGKEADVEAALKNYIELTKSNMENYLPEQFEIAQKSKIQTTKNGEVVLVMSETAAETFEKINSAL